MSQIALGRYLTYYFAALAIVTMPPVTANEAQEWNFKVYLDDKAIGYHNFRLTPQQSNGHKLNINAKFDVKFWFINAYKYRHNNTELWQKQCLKSIQSETNDNGDRSAVQGAVEGGKFYLENESGRTALSDCVMSFAYWDPAIIKADRLLNAQTGEYVEVDVVPLGRESVPAQGRAVLANRYRVIADKAIIDLWYEADSFRWLALESTTENGRKLRYAME